MAKVFDTRDIYRTLKRQKLVSVPETVFSDIVKTANQNLVDHLFEYGYVNAPWKVLSLTLVRYDCTKNPNKLINWSKTLDYWKIDTEAKKDKIFVYNDSKYIYSIKLTKKLMQFKGKTLLKFRPLTALRERLRKEIDNNNVKYL